MKADAGGAIGRRPRAGAGVRPTSAASGSIQVTGRRRLAWRSATRTAMRAIQAPNLPSPRHESSER